MPSDRNLKLCRSQRSNRVSPTDVKDLRWTVSLQGIMRARAISLSRQLHKSLDYDSLEFAMG